MNSFNFLQPQWLLTLPFVLLAWKLIARRGVVWPPLVPAPLMRFPLLQLLHAKAAHAPPKPAGTSIITAIALLLLIIALAQPAYLQTLPDNGRKKDDVDLILVVNTSVSMALRDNLLQGRQMNRMQVAKILLRQLIETFNGRRSALVILGRPPALWLPLTTDRKLTLNAVDRLQTTLGGRSSDIGETLQLVEDHFTPKARTIVLLVSDGDQQVGARNPLEAAAKLHAQGFEIHTLAIGSAQRTDLSLGKGHLIYTPVDLQLLRALAQSGGGRMAHSEQVNAVSLLVQRFRQPPAEQPGQTGPRIETPLYAWPLAMAMLLLLTQWILPRGRLG